MSETTTIYIHSLNDLLDRRRKRNESYSLRALARDIGIDNSYLIQILGGNKKVSPKVAYKIAMVLKLENEQMLSFILPSLQ